MSDFRLVRWLPALLSLGFVYAQSDLATITGVVSDPGEAVMPAVTVTVRNVDTMGR